jgi:hypothetical protein
MMKRRVALGGLILVSLGLATPAMADRHGSDSSGEHSYSLTCIAGRATFTNTSSAASILILDGASNVKLTLARRQTGRLSWPNGWIAAFDAGPWNQEFDHGDEKASDVCTVTPTAPRSVAATAGNRSARLSWAAPVRGAAIDYVIQRSVNGRTWTTLNDGVSTARSYRATGLANGTQYLFRVTARNDAGMGARSTVVRATPRTTATAPRSLTATARNRRVVLDWRAPASNGGARVVDYRIQRSANGGRWATIRDGRSRATEHVVTNLRNGTRYRFRVLAVNAAGNGAWSRPASATPHR